MLKFIYLIIIRPIETVLSFLFCSYVKLTGNFGVSIILLSLSVTIIMFPLFYIAEVWKRKEQAVEKRMKRRLDHIKKYYSGQKRYCLTKATHRLEGYTAASSFRTSFGLLIQIPFFFAAYHLLSHYEPYRGVSWWFINDFARPDGLIFGINALPVAMTLINIVSSSIYMKGSRFRDIVELYVMAGVFLLLLYGSPSALVLYWTMNNVFSVGKSLIFLRLFPHEKYVPDENEKGLRDYIRMIKDEVCTCLTPGFCTALGVFLLFVFQCRALIFHKRQFEHLFYGIALLAFILVFIFLWCWYRNFRQKRSSIAPFVKVLFSGLLFLAVSGTGFILKLQDADGPLLKKIIFIAAISADILIYMATAYLLGKKDIVGRTDDKNIKSLYIWNVLFLAGLVTLVWPVQIFLSSPAETGISIWNLLFSDIPVFLCLILLSFLIFNFADKSGRHAMAAVSMFLVMAVIVYRYIFPGNYGELDKTMLSMAEKLEDRSLFLLIRDLLVVGCLSVLSVVFIRHYLVQCRNVVAVICCCLLILTGIKTVKYLCSADMYLPPEKELVEIPADNDVINGYSRTGKNVVLFVADMFSGGYMQRIIEENPEYEQILSGFTWYRNTVAASWKTVCSMPSIFAGEEYLPIAMTKMGKNGNELIQESARIMFDNFSNHGYSIAVVNPGSSSLEKDTLKGTVSTDSDIFGKIWEQKYYSGSKNVNWINQGHLFIMLSIFQNSPYFLKPVIYNDSCWFIFSTSALYWSVREHVLKNYGFMKLLPEISNIEIENNTFKYFHNSLPHSPYGVDDNGTLVAEGKFPDKNKNSYYAGNSAYYSALEFIRSFVQWCNWLKANGIYDNTYIILLSDHGNDYENDNPLVSSKINSRLNSLLMVKKFSSCDELKKSDKLMCSSDASKFLKNAVDDIPVIIPDNRIVTTVRYDSSSKFLRTGNADFDIYEVHDNIFDPQNWEVLK
ncbi:MAG: YidC/Oxa1 family membrane protein insertase [Spirochaetia bacterium]|nr:YidC/Oxa1 family membrane protein insertase [Spirochaetia bacterium]